MNFLTGTYTAIVTPFSSDGLNVDYDSLSNLIELQIHHGVHGIVVCGSTGEAATLSDDEYKEVVKFTVSKVQKRAAIVGGIGTNSTTRAQEMAIFLEQSGVDYSMIVAPPYNKPTQEGILAHFEHIKAKTSLPLIAYNVPGRTGVNILPTTLASLVERGTIAGVKEASGSFDQIVDLLALVRNRIPVLSGDDSLTFAVMAAGGRGVISVVSNVAPDLVVTLTNSALRGEWERARNALYAILPLSRALFMESNPIPIKAALALRGIISSPTVRLPLTTAQKGTIEKLELILPKRG